jgi:LPXTG-motif cell wall-anchored protein
VGIRYVLAGAVLGLAGSALLAVPAAAAVPADPYGPAPTPPTLAVSSTTIPVGGTLVISGSGWAPGSTVSISSSVVAGFGRVDVDAGPASLGALLGPDGTRAAAPRRFAASCVNSCAVSADAAGAFSADLTLTRAGTTVVTASGVDPNGDSRTLSVTVLVTGGNGNGVGGGNGVGSGNGGNGAGNGGNGAGNGGSGAGNGGNGNGANSAGVGGAGALPNTGSDLRAPVLIGGGLVLIGAGALVFGRRRKRGGIAV